MTKKIYWLIGSLVGIALLAFAIRTAGADEFYKGKTIRIVVGSTAGGFYDRWARLLSRHMVKHIPGQPEMIVQIMARAGSVIGHSSGASENFARSISQNHERPRGVGRSARRLVLRH
jgi:tripartite-type tricarboxylate transporter receptor subunit TctC